MMSVNIAPTIYGYGQTVVGAPDDQPLDDLLLGGRCQSNH